MTLPLCAGHIKDGEINLVAATSEDVREMAVRSLEDALHGAAKRWAEASEECGRALERVSRDGRGPASAALYRRDAAKANYTALQRQVFRVLGQAVHEAETEVTHVS